MLPTTPPPLNTSSKIGFGYQWCVPLSSDDASHTIEIYGQYISANRPDQLVIVKTSAHQHFDNDGEGGSLFAAETIEMFRGIASGITGWKPLNVDR